MVRPRPNEPHIAINFPDEGIVFDPADNADPMFQAFGQMENAVHAQGWGQDPTVWIVPGTPERPGRAVQLPVDRMVWRATLGHPIRVMVGMANAMIQRGQLPPGWPVNALGVPAPFAGAAVLCEGDGMLGNAAARDPQHPAERGPRHRKARPSKRPGSSEGRMVFASTTDDRDIFLCRVVGHLPILTLLLEDDLSAEADISASRNGGARDFVEAASLLYRKRGWV